MKFSEKFGKFRYSHFIQERTNWNKKKPGVQKGAIAWKEKQFQRII